MVIFIIIRHNLLVFKYMYTTYQHYSRIIAIFTKLWSANDLHSLNKLSDIKILAGTNVGDDPWVPITGNSIDIPFLIRELNIKKMVNMSIIWSKFWSDFKNPAE